MPPNFADLVSSETFEIIAENGKKCFRVHTSTLKELPKPLHSTTTTTWEVATERRIDLSGWDGETVGRLIEYLYLGQYKPISGTEDGESEIAWRRGGQDGMDTPDTVQSLAGGEELREVDLDAGELLAHAKVYALAQYEGVEGLKSMALARLRAALGTVKPGNPGGLPVDKIFGRLDDVERQQLEAAHTEKIRQLEKTNTEEVRRLEDKVHELENELRRLKEEAMPIPNKVTVKEPLFPWDNPDPEFQALLKELMDMGITEDQIKENEDFIKSYIAEGGSVEEVEKPVTKGRRPRGAGKRVPKGRREPDTANLPKS